MDQLIRSLTAMVALSIGVERIVEIVKGAANANQDLTKQGAERTPGRNAIKSFAVVAGGRPPRPRSACAPRAGLNHRGSHHSSGRHPSLDPMAGAAAAGGGRRLPHGPFFMNDFNPQSTDRSPHASPPRT
jgi:hypothetical protein